MREREREREKERERESVSQFFFSRIRPKVKCPYVRKYYYSYAKMLVQLIM